MKRLGLTTIAHRHYRADMVQVYKILNDKKQVFSENFLELNKLDEIIL